MKTRRSITPSFTRVLLFMLCTTTAQAATWYVDGQSPSNGPGTSLANAFHTIQQGVDAANANDTVLVNGGTYDTGGAVVFSITNRVAITKPITLQSIKGAAQTIISGNGPVGNTAVRCAFLTNGASVIGFTLQNGHSALFALNDTSGGGAINYGYMEGCTFSQNEAVAGGAVDVRDGILINCVVEWNSAANGGGIHASGSSQIVNCEIMHNGCGHDGAGVYLNEGGTLVNCSLRQNWADLDGGGVYCYKGGTILNCDFEQNLATNSVNSAGGAAYVRDAGTFYNCRMFNNRATRGGGVASYNGGARLESCTISGNWGTANTGGVHFSPGDVALNCIVYENISGGEWGGYGASWTNCCTTPTYGVDCITIPPGFSTFGDLHISHLSPCTDAGLDQPWMTGATDLDGNPRIIGATVDIGAYESSPQYAGPSPVHYVSLAGGNSWPYTNWATAAIVIQDAVDAAMDGDQVLVDAGTYNVGDFDGNRVFIEKAITVESVSGAGSTLISGANTVRCVYLSGAGSLIGFTLSDGAGIDGGGLFLANGLALGCTIENNEAFYYGGGVYCNANGTLMSCFINDNIAGVDGGGVEMSPGGELYNCTIEGNAASHYGGGVDCWGGGLLEDCFINDNSASNGGGVYSYSGTLLDCSLEGNLAEIGGGVYLTEGSLVEGGLLGRNIAAINGGGAYFDAGGGLHNVHLERNEAGDGGGLYYHYAGHAENCTLNGNEATYFGGGAYTFLGGALNSCRIVDNAAGSGGGGVLCNTGGTLDRCRISGNVSRAEGGGVYCLEGGTLNNCVIDANEANIGGGAYSPDRGRLNNCTIAANTSEAAVIFAGVLNNCIVQKNSGLNWDGSDALWTNCCIRPPAGVNGFADAPEFVGGSDYHLQPSSPCIEGAILVPGLIDDFDGAGRPLDGDGDGTALPDVGAYEFASSSVDTDGDQVSDYEELVADTDGTDGNDWFRIAIYPDYQVGYNSSAARQYTLMYNTNLVSGLWNNVPGLTSIPGSGNYDYLTAPSNYPACFFRIEVAFP